MSAGDTGPVEISIKDLFKTQLSDIAEQNDATRQICKAIEDRLDDIVLRVDEFARLPARIDSLVSTTEALDSRLQAVEDMETERLRALLHRVDLIESDADGVGGLQQMWERLDGVRKEFDDLQLKAEQSNRAERELRARLDKADLDMLSLRQRLDDLAAALKLVTGLNELPDELRAQSKALEALRARIKALENFETDNLMAVEKKLRLIQDNADGIGGLKQVWEKLDVIRVELREMKPDIEQSFRIAKETKSRTDTFDFDLTKFRQQCDELSSIVGANDAHVKEMDELVKSINEVLIALEGRVDHSYETVRGRLLHEIEELEKRIQLQLEVNIDKGPPVRDPKNLVNYAMELVASVQAERKQQWFAKHMITLWKEQTWLQARQRLGIFAFKKIVHRKLRDVFVQGTRHASVVRIAASLREEFQLQLPDVHKILDESGWRERCDALEYDLGVVREGKTSNEIFDARLSDQTSSFEARLEELKPMRVQLVDHDQRLSALALRSDEQKEQLLAVDTSIDTHTQHFSALDFRLADFAVASEVQTVLRDVLLIWNSIKTLDATKADKKDLDCIAVESSGRERSSARRLEELSAELTVKVREELAGAGAFEERWAEVDGRLDETGRQFRHWEQMWDKLAGSVEDLVLKIASIQGGTDAVKVQQHTNRPSSRPVSASRAATARTTLPGRDFRGQALVNASRHRTPVSSQGWVRDVAETSNVGTSGL